MSNCASVYAAVLGMQGRAEWNGARPTPSGPRHRLGAWRMTCRRALRTIADIASSGAVLGGAHTPTEGELQTLPSTHQKAPADRATLRAAVGPRPKTGATSPRPRFDFSGLLRMGDTEQASPWAMAHIRDLIGHRANTPPSSETRFSLLEL